MRLDIVNRKKCCSSVAMEKWWIDRNSMKNFRKRWIVLPCPALVLSENYEVILRDINVRMINPKFWGRQNNLVTSEIIQGHAIIWFVWRQWMDQKQEKDQLKMPKKKEKKRREKTPFFLDAFDKAPQSTIHGLCHSSQSWKINKIKFSALKRWGEHLIWSRL